MQSQPTTLQAQAGHLDTAVRFIRLESAPATVACGVVGVATAVQPPSAAQVATGAAVGLLFHVFAFVSNDVIDLPADRTDQRRARSPLVAGVVGAPAATVTALAHLTLCYATLVLVGAERAARPLAAAAVTLLVYNLAGKRLRVPFVADVEQGTGFALLVYTAAWLVGDVTTATTWAMAFVVVFVAFINGVHGGVRDAENDLATGAHTTALLLGARTSTRSGVKVPATLALYAVVLQGAVVVVLVAPGLTGALRHDQVWQKAVWGIALLLACGSVGTLGLAHARRHDLGEAMSWGTWNAFLGLTAFVSLYASQLEALAALVAIASFVAPWLIFDRAVRATSFTLPGPVGPSVPAVRSTAVVARGLWQMTRPGNPLAAAVLAAAGGAVAGGPLPRYLVSMAAVAWVVSAANVFNDRCDEAVDHINRPDRPLPGGRVSPNDADRFVLASGVAAVAASAWLHAVAALVTGVVLVLALTYSLVWRRRGVLGPLAVGVLFASPIPVGGLFVSGSLKPVHGLAAGLVATFVFAREALKSVPDVRGDLASEVRTVAVRYGEHGALRVFRVGCLAFLAVLLVPVALGFAGTGYLLAALPFAAAPVVAALWTVRGQPSGAAVAAALDMTGRTFGLGLVPLIVLLV